MENFQLQDVFVKQGVPTTTFVKPAEYTKLLVSLKTSGRGIVIEGPSGIGKTTAVWRSIEEAGLSGQVLNLSARKKDEIDYIKNLPAMRPFGTVVIDDFHRLEMDVKKIIADLMKVLADESDANSKVVILGIPNVGEALLAFGKDLSNRIEVIRFEANSPDKIEELIAKGEEALNIKLNIKQEIIDGAQGSFYITQMLCHESCISAGFLDTQETCAQSFLSYEAIKAGVMNTLRRTFHGAVIAFCRGSKLRPEGRAPYLHVLKWLGETPNGLLNCEREAQKHPEQKGSVLQVVTKGYLHDLIEGSPDQQINLHYDKDNRILVAQDPQFLFYIRNISWAHLSEEVGYKSTEFRNKYDFALSFAGSDRKIAEAIFSELTEKDLAVFYDKNEQHRILAENIEAYLAPIYSSEASYVVCIIGKEYPRKIWTQFESQQFKDRYKDGAIIPIVVDSYLPWPTDELAKIGHLSFATADDFEIQIQLICETLTKKIAEV